MILIIAHFVKHCKHFEHEGKHKENRKR